MDRFKLSGLHSSAIADKSYTGTVGDDLRGQPPPDGIEAIAARIHERAQQLSNEQYILQLAERELYELREKVKHQMDLNQVVHVQYLNSVMKMNSMEMECIQIDEAIAECINKTDGIKANENGIVAYLSKKNAEWESKQETFTRHKLCQDFYLKILQGVIDQRGRSIARRTHRLETTKKLSEEIEQKQATILQSQDRMKSDMKFTSNKEDDENKIIESLASEVRDALAKVRILQLSFMHE
jgi:hypothetical protein